MFISIELKQFEEKTESEMIGGNVPTTSIGKHSRFRKLVTATSIRYLSQKVRIKKGTSWYMRRMKP